jgi:hypothetical protein
VAYALTQQYEKSRAVLTELQHIAPNHTGARELLRRLPSDSAVVRAPDRHQH